MSIAISGSTITFADLTTQSTAPVVGVGFKNRIYNGDMRIWQRGTTFAVGSTTFTYTADRFSVFSINTSTTAARSTSVPDGFQYSFQLQRPNGNTGTNNLLLTQIIETSNCYGLAGQSVTLSFWVKKGANYSGGNLIVAVNTGTVADEGGNSFGFTGLATPINNSSYAPTTTWSKVTYTGTFASNVLEAAFTIQFTPTGTAGADDSIYITGVQLEKGSTATEFERRPIGVELALCQRYYEILTADTEGVAITSFLFTGTHSRARWFFKTTKRAIPTTVALQTGSWINVTPTIYRSADSVGFSNTSGNFASNTTLFADAEL